MWGKRKQALLLRWPTILAESKTWRILGLLFLWLEICCLLPLSICDRTGMNLSEQSKRVPWLRQLFASSSTTRMLKGKMKWRRWRLYCRKGHKISPCWVVWQGWTLAFEWDECLQRAGKRQGSRHIFWSCGQLRRCTRLRLWVISDSLSRICSLLLFIKWTEMLKLFQTNI